MKRIVFACGAYLECKDESCPPVGERLIVFINDGGKFQGRPHIPEEAIKEEGLKPGSLTNCLLMCPCTVRESGRKTGRAWFGENADGPSGKPKLYTTCKVRSVVAANASGQIPPASGGNLDRLVGHSESTKGD